MYLPIRRGIPVRPPNAFHPNLRDHLTLIADTSPWSKARQRQVTWYERVIFKHFACRRNRVCLLDRPWQRPWQRGDTDGTHNILIQETDPWPLSIIVIRRRPPKKRAAPATKLHRTEQTLHIGELDGLRCPSHKLGFNLAYN